MATSKKITIAIAAGIAVLGVVAYFLWLRPTDEEAVTVTSTGPTNVAQATFLTLASQLEPVSFNGSILNDPRFAALVDIRTAIVVEPGGRKDPFAPLAGVREE